MQNQSKIKVWDPLVRIFHWTLVATFLIAYITEEDLLGVHVWAGYIMLAAIAVRLVWGLVGTRHARFSDFVTSPSTALRYVKDTFGLKAKRYIGHNPAGGWMIVIMLISLVATGMTGLLLYGAEEHAGPFAGWFAASSGYWEDALEEIHEFFANFTVFLVVVHLAGVLLESIVHKENLVAAMISGEKDGGHKIRGDNIQLQENP
ncbi:cytochrome b/b6 domain-containing protein [Kaarinaea lacus]